MSDRFEPPLVNIGVGEDITIAELAALVQRVHRLRSEQARRHAAQAELMDVVRLRSAGWQATAHLEAGLETAYCEFAADASL